VKRETASSIFEKVSVSRYITKCQVPFIQLTCSELSNLISSSSGNPDASGGT